MMFQIFGQCYVLVTSSAQLLSYECCQGWGQSRMKLDVGNLVSCSGGIGTVFVIGHKHKAKFTFW